MPGAPIAPGEVRIRAVARSYRLLHERNLTLKETLLRGRRTRHTDLWALREVDLRVRPGESVGLVGENGSGKSTLLKLIAGIIPPHRGSVEVGGRIGSMLELGAGFHPDFSGRDNVVMNAAIHGLPRREVERRMDDIVAFAELEAFIDSPVRTYSSGMYTRLGFSVAAHIDSDVLLLDEVLAVGDEAFQRKCIGRIFEYRRGGGTVIFVSHDAEAVQLVCDRAILLREGIVAADGTPQAVLAEYRRGLVRGGAPAQGAEDEWGTGAVRITDVRLIGPRGEATRFQSGAPLTIEIDFEAEEEVEAPVFGFDVRALDGSLMYGSNTSRDAHPIHSVVGPGRATIAIPELPLHEGRFAVSVSAHAEDHDTVYHWIDRRFEFSVFPRAGGIGAVDMSGSWEVEIDRPGVGAEVEHD